MGLLRYAMSMYSYTNMFHVKHYGYQRFPLYSESAKGMDRYIWCCRTQKCSLLIQIRILFKLWRIDNNYPASIRMHGQEKLVLSLAVDNKYNTRTFYVKHLKNNKIIF